MAGITRFRSIDPLLPTWFDRWCHWLDAPKAMFPRRYSRWVLIFLLSGSLWLTKKLADVYNSLPPLYSQYHWQEMALPQHSENLPHPNDGSRRFLWMSDHVRGYGKHIRRQDTLI